MTNESGQPLEEERKAETAQEESEEIEETQEAEIEELKPKDEEESYKEKFYYLAADMENLKKRFEKEKQSLVKFSNESIMEEMIEVMDNFERVIMAIENDQDDKMKNLFIGIDMVRKQFSAALAKFGLEPIVTEGKEFDPNFHEALSTEEAEGKKEQEILREYLKGYTLNGRVVRPAKVVVVENKE